MHPHDSPLLLKISSEGGHLWTSVYDNPSPEAISVETMSTDSEGNSWVIGSGEYAYSGCHDMPAFHVIRYDPTGDVYCEQTYRGGVYPGTLYWWARSGHDDNGNAYIYGIAQYDYCYDTATCEFIDGCTSAMDYQIFKYGTDCQTTWKIYIPYTPGDVVPWTYFVGNSGGILNHYFAIYQDPDSTTRIGWYNENGSLVRNLTPGGRVYDLKNYPDGHFLLFRKVGLGDDAPRYMTLYDSLGIASMDIPLDTAHNALTYDRDKRLYLLFEDRVVCYDSNLTYLWEGECTGYSLIEVDSAGSLYLADATYTSTDTTRVAKFRRAKKFAILDATASHSPLSEQDFELYEADPGQPGLITGHIGSYSTDADGAIEFSLSDIGELMHEDVGIGLEIGDLAVVSVRVTSASNPRHPTLLPASYSIWLDPVKFDEYGTADLESIDNQATQEYVPDHTEYRYNLLVSVEWDADEDYLEVLRLEFRFMSNFLYDVSDGQIRLDTVMIYDNGAEWDQVDIRIFATNYLKPVAGVLGMRIPEKGPIRMPRKWTGGRNRNRFLTHFHHPLDVALSANYRTMAHEFGHYALGFYDEYEFFSNYGFQEDRCESEANYGFMDYQYSDEGEHASEMSSPYRYADPDCRNTEQWLLNNSYP